MGFSSLLNYLTVTSLLCLALSQAEPLPHLHHLETRQRGRSVPIGSLNYSGAMPARQEVRTVLANTVFMDLFYQALGNLQKMDQSNPGSYYGIAAIHGKPYAPWGSETTQAERRGYCPHGDPLFGTWHRPYLALYEQAICFQARDIARKYRSNQAAYQKAAQNMRLPYWDYLVNPAFPGPWGSSPQVTVNGPTGSITIPNPMYSYKFHPLEPRQIDTPPFSSMRETLRNPPRGGGGGNNIQGVNSGLQNSAPNLCNRLYTILTTYDNYVTFQIGGGANQLASLEGVHSNIHTIVGGGGHMGQIEVASYDPIFWIHHCSIDRYLALWQAIWHQNWWPRGRQLPSGGTFGIRRGTPLTSASALVPFRDPQNRYWTSDTSRYVEAFGYTYPELMSSGRLSPAQKREQVLGHVNRLYGRCSPSRAVGQARKMKRKLKKRELEIGKLDKREEYVKEKKRKKFLRKAKSAKKFAKELLKEMALDPAEIVKVLTQVQINGVLNRYVADIRTRTDACGESFQVCVFIGDVPTTDETFLSAPNIVGCLSVFHQMDSPTGRDIATDVPLTDELIKMVEQGELENMNVDSVTKFLKEKMNYGVISSTKGVRDIKQMGNLLVRVTTCQSATEDDPLGMDKLYNFKDLPEVTEGKPGGFKRGQNFTVLVPGQETEFTQDTNQQILVADAGSQPVAVPVTDQTQAQQPVPAPPTG